MIIKDKLSLQMADDGFFDFEQNRRRKRLSEPVECD